MHVVMVIFYLLIHQYTDMTTNFTSTFPSVVVSNEKDLPLTRGIHVTLLITGKLIASLMSARLRDHESIHGRMDGRTDRCTLSNASFPAVDNQHMIAHACKGPLTSSTLLEKGNYVVIIFHRKHSNNNHTIFMDREAGEINTFGRVCLSVRFTSRSLQNGWAFKMVVVSTGCAIAVDHAFNYQENYLKVNVDQIMHKVPLSIWPLPPFVMNFLFLATLNFVNGP